jgi:hypothetical protein
LSTGGRKKIAEEIATEAKANAPVLSGDYRDGIAVEVDGDSVEVVDTDPDAVFKEYGTSVMAGHAVITDAARARGKYRGWKPRT